MYYSVSNFLELWHLNGKMRKFICSCFLPNRCYFFKIQRFTPLSLQGCASLIHTEALRDELKMTCSIDIKRFIEYSNWLALTTTGNWNIEQESNCYVFVAITSVQNTNFVDHATIWFFIFDSFELFLKWNYKFEWDQHIFSISWLTSSHSSSIYSNKNITKEPPSDLWGIFHASQYFYVFFLDQIIWVNILLLCSDTIIDLFEWYWSH